MKRGITFAAAFAAALVSIHACAREPQASTTFTSGTNYEILGRPQATAVAPGKVEAIEFFWYGCAHCYALDPTLETWNKTKPQYLEFHRIPVIWSPLHRLHAKIYYVLQQLNRLDLHPKAFDTIHREHNLLLSEDADEAKTREIQWKFFAANGISKTDFDAAYDSPAVEANLEHAREMTFRYAIQNVPTMVVDGTYETNVTMAGGAAELTQVVDFLAARVKKP